MHDLATIHKLNAEAYAQGIDNFRKQGRHVLAIYSGLHLMSVETFTTAEEATTALEAIPANCGDHGKLYAPYPTIAAIVTERPADLLDVLAYGVASRAETPAAPQNARWAGDTAPSEVDPYLTTR